MCTNGYTGTRCETPPNPCTNYSCGLNGTCQVVNNQPSCSCINGYSGSNCQTPPVSSCSTFSCPSGSRCVLSNGQPVWCVAVDAVAHK